MKKVAAKKNIEDLLDYNNGEEITITCISGRLGFDLTIRVNQKAIGSITVTNAGAGAFKVSGAYAANGWGPLMYDWAMEHAYTLRRTLGCDVGSSVSLEAQAVWNYYLHNRSDVEAIPRIDWSTYKSFVYSLRQFSGFYSLKKILNTHNKDYLLEKYPLLFNAVEQGLPKSNLNEFWLEYENFKEDDPEFFDWAQNQGIFYTFEKPHQQVEKQILAGVDEGWFEYEKY